MTRSFLTQGTLGALAGLLMFAASSSPARGYVIRDTDPGPDQLARGWEAGREGSRRLAAVSTEDSEATHGPAVHPPVPSDRRLSSPFGMRHGRRTGRLTFHAGVDFDAELGTPVYAVRSGVVERVLRDRERRNGFQGYGNGVVVYHPDEDRWSFYAHLQSVDVHEGDELAAGQQIGRVGATSNRRFAGMGAHLHFEVRERAADGGSPFPGPYRLNNLDPRVWLATHGLTYDRRGDLRDESPAVESSRDAARAK